ncbi:hypothetical protein D3C78_1229390 [compost metagenome]
MQVADQQVEPGIFHGSADNVGQIVGNRHFAREKPCHQFTPRAAGRRLVRVADIGQRGEAPIGTDSQPGATGLQVTAGVHLRGFGPLRQRQAGAGIELVTVGRDDQGRGVIRAPGENNQAHKVVLVRFSLTLRRHRSSIHRLAQWSLGPCIRYHAALILGVQSWNFCSIWCWAPVQACWPGCLAWVAGSLSSRCWYSVSPCRASMRRC